MPSPMPEPTPPTPGTRTPIPTSYDLRHDTHAARSASPLSSGTAAVATATPSCATSSPLALPGLPPWLPADALRVAFPFADPRGVVTRKLLAWIATEDRLPFFVGKR